MDVVEKFEYYCYTSTCQFCKCMTLTVKKQKMGGMGIAANFQLISCIISNGLSALIKVIQKLLDM